MKLSTKIVVCYIILMALMLLIFGLRPDFIPETHTFYGGMWFSLFLWFPAAILGMAWEDLTK